ncbi:unnamed protein product, partial [Polarella glacialis]
PRQKTLGFLVWSSHLIGYRSLLTWGNLVVRVQCSGPAQHASRLSSTEHVRGSGQEFCKRHVAQSQSGWGVWGTPGDCSTTRGADRERSDFGAAHRDCAG